MEKEQFINEILNSTNGITKVIPSDDLLLRIEQKIQTKRETPITSMWFIAASVLVFFSLNIVLLQISTSASEKSVSSFALELNMSNQFYK